MRSTFSQLSDPSIRRTSKQTSNLAPLEKSPLPPPLLSPIPKRPSTVFLTDVPDQSRAVTVMSHYRRPSGASSDVEILPYVSHQESFPSTITPQVSRCNDFIAKALSTMEWKDPLTPRSRAILKMVTMKKTEMMDFTKFKGTLLPKTLDSKESNLVAPKAFEPFKRHKTRSDIISKIERFRTDPLAAAEFGAMVDGLIQDRHDKRFAKVSEKNIRRRNIDDAGRKTPDVMRARRVELTEIHNKKEEAAVAKRSILRAWRLERKIQLIEAPLQRQLVRQALSEVGTLVNAWKTFHVCAIYPIFLANAMKSMQSKAKESKKDPRKALTNNSLRGAPGRGPMSALVTTLAANRIVLVWRLHRAYRRHNLRTSSIDLIRKFFLQQSPLETFLLSVRKFTKAVKMVQRQYRSRSVWHEFRRMVVGMRLDAALKANKSISPFTLARITHAIRLPFVDRYVRRVERTYWDELYEYGTDLETYHNAVEEARREFLYRDKKLGRSSILIPPKPVPPSAHVFPSLADINTIISEIMNSMQQ